MNRRGRIGMNRKGFTLVELITVIAIIGIIAAIATPALMAVLPNVRLREGARTVYQTLMQAKMEAVKRNTAVTVRLTPVTCGSSIPAGGHGQGGSFRVSYVDTDGGGEINILQGDFPPFVAMCKGRSSLEEVVFKPNGMPKAKGGCIALTNTKERDVYAVLAMTGRIRLADKYNCSTGSGE